MTSATKAFAATALLLLPFTLAASKNASGSKQLHVLPLTDATFDEHVWNTKVESDDDKYHHIVEFYAPWCGFCKKLAPEYEKLPGLLADNEDPRLHKVRVTQVDATVNEALKNRYSISGYPTVLFFSRDDPSRVVPYEPKKVEDLAALPIVDFVRREVTGVGQVPQSVPAEPLPPSPSESSDFWRDSRVIAVSPDDIEEYTTDTDLRADYILYFFTANNYYCNQFNYEFKRASMAFAGSSNTKFLALDTDKYSDSLYVKQLGLASPLPYPVIEIFWLANPQAMVVDFYQDSRTAEGLVEHLINRRERPDVAQEARKETQRGEVATLDAESFSATVNDPRYHAVVGFTAPWCGHCKKFKPELQAFAQKWKDMNNIIVAEVNTEEHKELALQENITALPTIRFYHQKQKSAIVHQGANTADGLTEWLGNFIETP